MLLVYVVLRVRSIEINQNPLSGQHDEGNSPLCGWKLLLQYMCSAG